MLPFSALQAKGWFERPDRAIQRMLPNPARPTDDSSHTSCSGRPSDRLHVALGSRWLLMAPVDFQASSAKSVGHRYVPVVARSSPRAGSEPAVDSVASAFPVRSQLPFELVCLSG